MMKNELEVRQISGIKPKEADYFKGEDAIYNSFKKYVKTVL